MKEIATFETDDGMLIGAEAEEAWASQTAECKCGDRGDESETIWGTCGGRDAKWLGCTNCSGQALGVPLVYRFRSEVKVAK